MASNHDRSSLAAYNSQTMDTRTRKKLVFVKNVGLREGAACRSYQKKGARPVLTWSLSVGRGSVSGVCQAGPDGNGKTVRPALGIWRSRPQNHSGMFYLKVDPRFALAQSQSGTFYPIIVPRAARPMNRSAMFYPVETPSAAGSMSQFERFCRQAVPHAARRKRRSGLF